MGTEIEGVHEQASAATGLIDFGDEAYLEGLRALLASLDADARLTAAGTETARAMIVAALAGRLRSEAEWKAHPDHAQQPVEAPLVIIGLPRTGTTALHHLISCGPQFQALEPWLAGAPRPRPPREAWPRDPDFRACDARLRAQYALSPEMRTIHWMAADLPDECWRLLDQSFAHACWQANFEVPGYARWWADHDMRPAYRRHRRNLQLIGLGAPERRWLLKDATHLFDLDAFLEVYPDARVVFTHRDPVELIPSLCSLCWAARRPLNEPEDPAAFGRATLELWERAVLGALEVRDRREGASFHDLPFEAFRADPHAAIAGIHERFGLPLTGDAAAAMRRFEAGNPPGKLGSHEYSLEQWGLDAGEIRERFAPYTQRFDL